MHRDGKELSRILSKQYVALNVSPMQSRRWFLDREKTREVLLNETSVKNKKDCQCRAGEKGMRRWGWAGDEGKGQPRVLSGTTRVLVHRELSESFWEAARARDPATA